MHILWITIQKNLLIHSDMGKIITDLLMYINSFKSYAHNQQFSTKYYIQPVDLWEKPFLTVDNFILQKSYPHFIMVFP